MKVETNINNSTKTAPQPKPQVNDQKGKPVFDPS